MPDRAGASIHRVPGSTLDRIAEAPDRWRILEQDVRRCLVPVFPYVVLYSIESDYVLIIAIMHCSREPGYWNQRIERGAPSSKEPRMLE